MRSVPISIVCAISFILTSHHQIPSTIGTTRRRRNASSQVPRGSLSAEEPQAASAPNLNSHIPPLAKPLCVVLLTCTYQRDGPEWPGWSLHNSQISSAESNSRGRGLEQRRRGALETHSYRQLTSIGRLLVHPSAHASRRSCRSLIFFFRVLPLLIKNIATRIQIPTATNPPTTPPAIAAPLFGCVVALLLVLGLFVITVAFVVFEGVSNKELLKLYTVPSPGALTNQLRYSELKMLLAAVTLAWQ